MLSDNDWAVALSVYRNTDDEQELALMRARLGRDRGSLQQQLTATTERAERAEASAEALNAMLKRVAYDLSPHDLGYWGEVNALLESDQPGAALLADACKVGAALLALCEHDPDCISHRSNGEFCDCQAAVTAPEDFAEVVAICKARGWDKEEADD